MLLQVVEDGGRSDSPTGWRECMSARIWRICAFLSIAVRIWRVCAYLHVFEQHVCAHLHVSCVSARIWRIMAYLRVSVRIWRIGAYLAYVYRMNLRVSGQPARIRAYPRLFQKMIQKY